MQTITGKHGIQTTSSLAKKTCYHSAIWELDGICQSVQRTLLLSFNPIHFMSLASIVGETSAATHWEDTNTFMHREY